MLPKKAAKPKKRAKVDKGQQLNPWPFRHYQQDTIEAFDAGKRRQMLIWHRRAGKDVFGLSLARREAQINVGGYWHFFPKHVQARRAIWNGVDPKLGRNFIDVAFGDILAHRNNTEMFLELDSGSTWQLLGSDNYDRLVGGNARGVIFSEWALCDPRAWDYIRPIILENKGWALFITTYRGRNHAWQMAQGLRNNPEWRIDVRTVNDTRDLDGQPIISADDIEKERGEGTSEAIIQQEYFCNPAAAVPGAVYGLQTQRLRESDRINARWTPLMPVVAAWDFSQLPTSSAVVFCQHTPNGLRALAGELLTAMTLPECLAHVRNRPWKVAEHLIGEESEPLVNVLSDMRVFPTVMRTRQPGHVETITQAAIETMDCNATDCEDLLDSLSGYTRHDISDNELRPMFSQEYDLTWHTQLARAFELAALNEYEGGMGGGWHRPQRYSNSDKRVI